MAISSVTATQVNAYSSSMALGLLQTGVSDSTGASSLLGVSSSSSSSGYTAADLFGGSSSSSAFSIASDTFASVLTSQSENMVRLSVQQATARIKAQASAKIDQAQKTQAAAKSLTA
jgi:ribosomal protein L25 (general stress protein Ctc)